MEACVLFFPENVWTKKQSFFFSPRWPNDLGINCPKRRSPSESITPVTTRSEDSLMPGFLGISEPSSVVLVFELPQLFHVHVVSVEQGDQLTQTIIVYLIVDDRQAEFVSNTLVLLNTWDALNPTVERFLVAQ
jgi:hypothetical protein